MPERVADLTACRLVSQRLALDPLRLEHADELALILDDPALHRFIGGLPPTPDELQARLERQVRGRSPDGREVWLNWVVRERATGHAVGTVQASIHAEQDSCVAVLGWVTGTAYQNQGLATEAAGLMASWLHRQDIAPACPHRPSTRSLDGCRHRDRTAAHQDDARRRTPLGI